jgi:SSS family solute:Na+ symporter
MKLTFAFYCVIGYLIAVTLAGLYYARKVKTDEDYSVAGRSLPTIVLIGTLMATWMGAGTVLGGPAATGYQFGIFAAVAFSLGSPVGQLILTFIAKRIRRLNAQTVPEVIELVYGPFARIIATIIIALAYIGIVAYQYQGVGLILNSILGIPVQMGTLIAFGVIVVTALFGGLYSVAYTDFLSCIMMMAGLIIGVPMAISMAGGWSWVVANVPPTHFQVGGVTFTQLLGFFFPVFFYVMGDQNMYQRFFAARDEETARKSGLGWMIGCLITYLFVAAGSITARALYPDIPAAQSFVHLASHGMPTVIGGICVAAIAAFIITTANSFLLSVGVNVSWDVYSRFINRQASTERKLFVSRASVLGLGILAYVVIQYFPELLILQQYTYTMYGAAITPVLIAAVIWPHRVTVAGGVTSILTGGIVTIAWEIAKRNGWAVAKTYPAVLIAAPLAIAALLFLQKKGSTNTTSEVK